ncbi:MAG: GDYXXLXY domain-containing protein [Lysobacterales bacterium]
MAEGRWRCVVTLLAAVVALATVNLSIAQKERLLADGRVVCLELAPVDPRSLMQGDYMQLNYRLADDISRLLPGRAESQPWQPDLAPADGRAVVTLNPRAVARFARLDDGRPLAAGEILLRYRVRAGRLRFASDAYFFQEGTAEAYESARYGCYRVATDGAMLLTSLHDEGLDKLPPATQ